MFHSEERTAIVLAKLGATEREVQRQALYLLATLCASNGTVCHTPARIQTGIDRAAGLTREWGGVCGADAKPALSSKHVIENAGLASVATLLQMGDREINAVAMSLLASLLYHHRTFEGGTHGAVRNSPLFVGLPQLSRSLFLPL